MTVAPSRLQALAAVLLSAVSLTTTAILLCAAAPDPDQLHPDPRLQGVGIDPEHTRWTMAKFEEQVRRNPKSAVAHLELGNAHLLSSDTDEALPEFDRAIQLDPRCARAYIGRYCIFCTEGQYKHAFAELKKAYDAGPRDLSIDALNLQATMHKELKQFPEALSEYTRVIDSKLLSKHRLAFVYMNRGICHDRVGKVDLAISDYSKAAELDPKLGGSFLYRGNDYRGMHDYKRALADYAQVIGVARAGPGSEHSDYAPAIRKDAYRYRAMLFSAIGRQDLANIDRMSAYHCEREDLEIMPFRTK